MNDGFQKYSEEKHKRKMKEMEKSCVRSASMDTLDVCGKGNIGKYRIIVICTRPLIVPALKLYPHLLKKFIQLNPPFNSTRI